MAKTVTASELSPEERALIEMQLDLAGLSRDLLTNQTQLQKAIGPFLFEEMGLKPIFSESVENPRIAELSEEKNRINQKFDKELQDVDARMGAGGIQGVFQKQLFAEVERRRGKELEAIDLKLRNEPDMLEPEITGFERLPIDPGDQERIDMRDQLETQLLQAQLDALSRESGFAESRQVLEEKLLNEQIAAITREEELAPERQAVEKQLLERSLAALRGELPVDPGLLKDLDDQESELRDQLRRQLGSGFETSSPGIEALSEFESRKNEILERVRRGDIEAADRLRETNIRPASVTAGSFRPSVFDPSLGEALAVGGFNQDIESMSFQQLFGGLSAFGGEARSTSAGFGGVGGSVANVSAIFADQRRQELEAAMFNAKNKRSFGDVFGSIFAGGLAGGFSEGLSGRIAEIFD